MRIATFFKILPVLVLLCGTCLLEANEKDLKARLTIKDLGVICGKIVPVDLDPGLNKSESTVNIRAYKSIPYAKPPVGELRWQAPQPHEGWSGELDATQPCPQCPQPLNCNTNSIREDCLYLNVWTPSEIKTPRPVMVFIHGGAFVEGSGGGSLFNGSYLAAKRKAVVVTINYRLGVLGFLVYHKEKVYGNFGLMDQHLALKWVKKHIKSFGGDENNITVFGESAGAMSIGFHLMMENPLFNAAIVESNPYTIPTLTGDQADKLGKMLVKNTGMSVRDMRNMEWCALRPKLDKAAENIPAYAIFKWGTKGLICWKPIIQSKTTDKTYVFPSQPINVVPKRPLIIGTNRDEGLMFADLIDNALKKLLDKYLRIKPCERMNAAEYTAIIGALFHDPIDTGLILLKYPPLLGKDNTFQLARVMTDGLFTGGNLYYMDKAVKADGKDLYAYYYTYRSKSYWYPVQCPELCDCKKNVCHSAELPYVFHNFDSLKGKGSPDDRDKAFSDSITGYWTDFAKNKKPGSSWDDWSKGNYLKLDMPPNTKVTRGDMEDKCKYSLWKPIIEHLNK